MKVRYKNNSLRLFVLAQVSVLLSSLIVSDSLAQTEYQVIIDKVEKIESRYHPIHHSFGYLKSLKMLPNMTAQTSPKNLILLGETVYDIIKDGKAVIQSKYQPISVLPGEVEDFAYPSLALDEWRGPAGYRYSISFKGKKGMKNAGLTFAVIWSYNGQYNNKGRYISGLQIIPEKIWVNWGQKLDMNAVVDDVFSYGKASNPVAAVRLRLNYKISKLLKEVEENLIFIVDGTGKIRKF